jgi:hypothetical protein
MPLLYALVWVIAAALVGFAGRDRAFGFWGFFVASLVLTPIPCILLLLLTAPAPHRG